MKRIILASALLSVLPGLSFASELCGTVGSYTVRPNCSVEIACPMWIRLQYDITTVDGQRINIGAPNTDIMDSIESQMGNEVCLQGQESNGSFLVSLVQVLDK